MSKAMHTPGPWHWNEVKERGCSPHAVEFLRGIVANAPVSKNGGIPIGCEFIVSHVSPHNAERIVACVNACEGVADPSVVPDLIIELRRAHAMFAETIKIARKGRDLDCVDVFGAFNKAKASIEELIARAEGKS
jgi:hypothetical protein